jgi:ergothioneine biosynthesis protein EgtB
MNDATKPSEQHRTMGASTMLERYRAVREATEALAAPLSPEDQLLQSMPSASPTKWHRAHTTWFFEEFILAPRGVPAVDDRFRYLFNSYYEAVGPRHPRPARGMLSRPSASEVADYRRAVDGRMLELVASLDERELAALGPLLELGLAHEEQHQELLLTDILHALHQSPLRPAYRPAASRPPMAPSTEANEAAYFVEHEAGLVTIGHDTARGFAFDNEGPRHRVWLEPYALASRPVSNAELAAFIEAGGYTTPSLWLSEGYDWVKTHALSAPLYVEAEPGSLYGFTLDGMLELDPGAPAAHLSYYEADALARFLGARLPTEAEWEHAAAGLDPREGNLRESGALRPKPGRRPSVSLGQMFGDVWEWTSSAYAPYPGFAAASGAVGEYNGKFMVNQLVLRGGSCVTPRSHLRASYRNFWHADTRFQFTGARLAKSISGASSRVESR